MIKIPPTNKNILIRVATTTIRLYQIIISPIIGGRATCRFTPNCSTYAIQAIEKHGFLRGCIMAIRRIIRCRPGGGYGYAPVP